MKNLMTKTESIRLYNLFPGLVGNMTNWKKEIARISDMGFNAIWVNPFHYPGFSGSLYSPKDYYKFNPLFVDQKSKKTPEKQLLDVINECHKKDMIFLMDLVINHTAIDCPLIKKHPDWFKRDEKGEVINPGAMHDGEWHKWGDLAEVDNLNSPDRKNLWDYWWKMMEHYLELGVDGFRCDMAYQVPSELWTHLISSARKKKNGCLFIAESLGCDFKQVKELAELGFDYLFNSVKFWDFNAPWGMEQYYSTCNLTPSISFPESHDTVRLMKEVDEDLNVVKQRIIFCSLFSAGYMIPSGFEFGFKNKTDVVKTRPEDWEKTDIDLTDLLTKIAQMKKKYKVLNYEPGLEIVDQANWPNVFCFKRAMPGEKTVFVIINKDTLNQHHVFIPDIEAITGPGAIDISFDKVIGKFPRTLDYTLAPAQIKIIAQD